MLRKILAYCGIALGVCLIWIFAIFALGFIHFTSAIFNVVVSVLVTCLATAASVCFAYRVSGSSKKILGLFVLLGCVFLAYPVYGPGQAMDQIFEYKNYGYFPTIGMLLSGALVTVLVCRYKVWQRETE